MPSLRNKSSLITTTFSRTDRVRYQIPRIHPLQFRLPALGQTQQWNEVSVEGATMIGLPQSGDNRPGIMFIRGPEVEVLSPKTLREKVTQLHDQAAQLNQNPWR